MENTKVNSTRILSIDTLRGFDMFWISGGDGFFIALFTFLGWTGLALQLDHPAWNGFRFYDTIFPLFLFLVGLSMPLSITRRMSKGESRKVIYKHVFKRAILLYILGLFYNGLLDLNFETLRYTGVLHRIAITYLLAALIIMNFKKMGQFIWILVLTFGYWLVLFLIPVPGVGAYHLTPSENLCAYVDQQLLPGSFCCYGYGDNEGILSTIPAIASVLIGVRAGDWLLGQMKDHDKVKRFVLVGVSLIVVALIWNSVYPINKYLWTGSFVSLTSGISFLLLALFYWIIDVKGYTKWTFPFRVYGLNSITIYVVAGLFDFGIIAKIFIHGFYTSFGDFQTTFLEFSILLAKWMFLYFLYKQRIFLKV